MNLHNNQERTCSNSDISVVQPNLDVLLSRLTDVRKYGNGWRTRCPVHEGRSNTSLSLAVGEDGRILMHCFSGCEPVEILRTVGLELKDLFPPGLQNLSPLQRRERKRLGQFAKQEAARSVLEQAARVIWVAGRQLRAGEPLSDEDSIQLDNALERVVNSGGILNGNA